MLDIYEPAEDSYLMSDVIKEEIPKLLNKNPEFKLLEIGVGSGINLNAILKAGIKKENTFGCDINEEAVKNCKNLVFNCVVSDLFENVKGKFDLIIFNPPYLPEDKREPKKSRVSTTGGLQGNEIIVKFLKQAKSYLNESGKIFLITSSLSKKIDFNKFGYIAKNISSEKLFFEKLFVWECLKI